MRYSGRGACTSSLAFPQPYTIYLILIVWVALSVSTLSFLLPVGSGAPNSPKAYHKHTWHMRWWHPRGREGVYCVLSRCVSLHPVVYGPYQQSFLFLSQYIAASSLGCFMSCLFFVTDTVIVHLLSSSVMVNLRYVFDFDSSVSHSQGCGHWWPRDYYLFRINDLDEHQVSYFSK